MDTQSPVTPNQLPPVQPQPQMPQQPQPVVAEQPKDKKSPSIVLAVLVVVLLAIVGVGGYWLGMQQRASLTPDKNTVVPNQPEEEGVACTMDAKLCPDGSYVGRVAPSCEFAPCPSESASSAPGNSGLSETYTDPSGVYTISYPADFTLDTTNNPAYVSIRKWGPTQTENTEGFDMASVTIETQQLAGQTLSEWVDAQIQNTVDNGTATITEPKQAVTINGYAGYTYSVQGLGDFKNYVLQIDPNSNNVVVLRTSAPDPTGQGFEATVMEIVNSITLMK